MAMSSLAKPADPANRMSIAVLIDADNISPSAAGAIFRKACSIGEPIARRAYGMVKCFSSTGGWVQAQREFGIVARPQTSNVAHKNVSDIALVIDAMEFLYKSPCEGIFIVSSDSDFTALATKIREGGKLVYGMGSEKTPQSFRTACSRFFEIPKPAAPKSPKTLYTACPRCGGKLTTSRTKSNHPCRICPSCGGVSCKLSVLNKVFAADGLKKLLETAKLHQQRGCICPDCGSSMSLLKVTAGKIQVEIDVCGLCGAVWYDKNEFETLVPNDGLILPTVTSGKAYRREMVLTLTADLRSGHLKVLDTGSLQMVMKASYHVPQSDIAPIISTLTCQKVISSDKKTGRITVLLAGK